MAAQTSGKAYFQQRADYVINVSLDDRQNMLTGDISIRYANNSPDLLDRIGIHLWPNAYSSHQTAFGKQKLLSRSTKFYDAKEEDLGYIDDMDFKVDERPARLEYVKGHKDMAWLILPEPLKPGQAVVIKTPFRVKLPASFSRLGHANQTYQITQWYPKPAVYDHKGWHLMPYLDQGEFYSEFGNFTVNIDLPEEYVVGATGTLLTEGEFRFLEKRMEDTRMAIESGTPMSFEESPSPRRKKLTYKADQVHDFAWFADRRFYVQKQVCTLASGRTVDAWSMFNDLEGWKNSAGFVKRAGEFYSAYVGEYPWPQATAVESALSAGAGMEYPMITVIGSAGSESSLDEVITHEVGHNWFYGILASNEREHPFMDESINTYYEKRYMDEYYPAQASFSSFPFTKWLGPIDTEELMYLALARLNMDQHPGQHSENFMAANYGLDVYSRAPKLIQAVEEYIGTEEFDRIMQSYYNKWKFKHPYPEDLEAEFKSGSTKDLDWFFKQLLVSDRKIDYAVCNVRKKGAEYELSLRNCGGVASPVRISALRKGEIVRTENFDGFKKHRKLKFPDGDYDQFRIDAAGETYELYRQNNSIRTKGLFRKVEPIRIKPLAPLDDPYKTEIGISPVLGWNKYNGWMLGAYISQPWFPSRKWRFAIMPLYSFGNKTWAGSNQFFYNHYFYGGQVRQFRFGWNAKRYGLSNFLDRDLNYMQWSPYAELTFRTKPALLQDSRLRYSFHMISDEVITFPDTFLNDRITKNNYIIQELKYSFTDPHVLHPRNLMVLAQFQSYDIADRKARYLRIDAEFTQKIRIRKGRYFEWRTATSFFPVNTEMKSRNYAARSEQGLVRGSAGAAFQGYHDYTNEDLFLGRSEYDGLWSQQIMIRQGGMKLAPGVAQRNNLGNTNSFLAAVNLSSDLPIKKVGGIIRPYFDMAYVHSYDPDDPNLLASGGINLQFGDKFFNVYFPVFHSKAIRDQYRLTGNHNYWKEITFSINFKLSGTSDLAKFIQLN